MDFTVAIYSYSTFVNCFFPNQLLVDNFVKKIVMDVVRWNVMKELSVWIYQLLELELCVEPVHWDPLEMDSNAMVQCIQV